MNENRTFQSIPQSALTRSLAHFARPKGNDLLERSERFYRWIEDRRQAGIWPYSRSLESSPGPTTMIRDDCGHAFEGINFASQDYLGLAAHPVVREAAAAAIDELGPHSAGSPALSGNTTLSLQLEEQLAETFNAKHAIVFATGWAAGFGTVVGLVRPNDHIVIDQLAHACLQQGVHAATANVNQHKHLDINEVRRILREIRSRDTRNGILVISEGLFSMDSDVPDIQALQETCHEFNATLMMDIAHDFGSLGPDGTGSIGMQNMLGKVDLVMGSFSKTFASNGGFLVCQSPAVTQMIKCYGNPHTFSNALSPVQAASVLAALRIVRSDEGEKLRALLYELVSHMRTTFSGIGIDCIGEPTAIVPVPIGKEAVARIASAISADRGVLINLVEFPAVAVGAARFRMQAMATHTKEQAAQAAQIVKESIDDAEEIVNQRE